jgi:uncharacterized protein
MFWAEGSAGERLASRTFNLCADPNPSDFSQSLYCTLPLHPQTAAMELDLLDVQFDLRNIKPRELEEAFEDPFSVRFLPDNERADGSSRYYGLGRTIADRYLFFAFWTDGKTNRVVAAREMSDAEQKFYDRKYAEFR